MKTSVVWRLCVNRRQTVAKDAAIILEDADLDLTAKNIVAGAFNYSGQRCTAIKRVL